jgi:hypothetical protein
MAKAKKLSNEKDVAAYMNTLQHPLKIVVEALRNAILATDTEIREQVKWNSLASYYTGKIKPFDPKEYKRDIVVFNLHKKDFVLLVFPTGATINDTTGLLEGKFPDGRKWQSFQRLKR